MSSLATDTVALFIRAYLISLNDDSSATIIEPSYLSVAEGTVAFLKQRGSWSLKLKLLGVYCSILLFY